VTAFYSAKQVATRIGTDAKTLRKFLRSPASPYDAVGQGKRYEFPQADLAEIKAAFNRWQSKAKAKPAPKPTPKPLTEVHTTKELPHAVLMGDKGKCLKCGGPADSPLHIKIVKPDPDSARRTREAAMIRDAAVPDYDNPEDDWQEFDPNREPTEGELADLEHLLEDLED
jgi:hypothetical protein